MTTNHKTWIDDLVLELRLRDVKGDVIGDVVASVEQHVAESGETPLEAFGDPREFGRDLDFREDQLVKNRIDARGWLRIGGSVLAGLTAMILVTPVVTAHRLGRDAGVSWGDLATIGIFLFTLALFAVAFGPLVRRANLGTLVGVVSLLGVVAANVLLQDVAFSLPVWLGAVLIMVLLVVSVVGAWGRHDQKDEVIDPVSGEDRYGGRGKLATMLAPAMAWSFVVITILFGILSWYTAG